LRCFITSKAKLRKKARLNSCQNTAAVCGDQRESLPLSAATSPLPP